MTDITRESEESISLLGNQHTQYPTDYDPSVLETFLNKHPENDYFVKFNCPEFTSLCPITGSLILPLFIFPMFRASVWWKARA